MGEARTIVMIHGMWCRDTLRDGCREFGDFARRVLSEPGWERIVGAGR